MQASSSTIAAACEPWRRVHPALAALASWFAARGFDAASWLAEGSTAPPALDTLNRWMRAVHACGSSFHFVPAAARCTAAQYERTILASGAIATRRVAHDLCNALAWIAFAGTKPALNRLHCAHLGDAAHGRRGAVRDAVTLLDEYGVIVLTDAPALVELWRQHAWRRLFHDHRRGVERHMRAAVLGHGLVSALRRPYPSLTAKALVIETPHVPVCAGDIRAIDACAAVWLDAHGGALTPATLLPLPVVAWPGWMRDNAGPERFDDKRIFRPMRTRYMAAPAATDSVTS